jgi:hypothetical protein
MKPLSDKQLFFYSKNKLVILLYDKNIKRLIYSIQPFYLYFFLFGMLLHCKKSQCNESCSTASKILMLFGFFDNNW